MGKNLRFKLGMVWGSIIGAILLRPTNVEMLNLYDKRDVYYEYHPPEETKTQKERDIDEGLDKLKKEIPLRFKRYW